MNARTTIHCQNHHFQDYKDYQDKKFVTSDQTKKLIHLDHSSVRRYHLANLSYPVNLGSDRIPPRIQ